MNDEPKPKVSSRRPIGFRPGELRDWLDGLAKETGKDLSEVIRIGLTACKPQIDAIVRKCGPNPSEEFLLQLASDLEACMYARTLDLNPRAVLRDAATQSLGTPS
ncbi:MAG TPA: hypothetical protein VHF69_12415 [Candidatus Synoicihabitans sp.]|nr:hypothetical protein [Candidatus Synoicihabitans sp.]